MRLAAAVAVATVLSACAGLGSMESEATLPAAEYESSLSD
jgi:hypothetical protein